MGETLKISCYECINVIAYINGGLTLKVLITTVADDVLIFFFIHNKKKKKKKIRMLSPTILLSALRFNIREVFRKLYFCTILCCVYLLKLPY